MGNALSIFIPTYNRSHKLVPLLQYLNSKVPENVSVNIINNLSTDGTKEAVLTISKNLNYKINYFENTTNIGGNANIIRCFEYCTTEWLWILGDDDLPQENAIQTILEKINLYPDAVFVNFKTTLSAKFGDTPETTDVISKGQTGLIKNMKSFPNVLFISASIYNATELKKNIKTAYYFCYSCAPQTAILLDYLADYPSKQIVYSADFICNWEIASEQDQWNDNAVNASLPEILFVVNNKEDKITLFNKINLFHPSTGFTKKDVLSSLIGKSSPRSSIAVNHFSSNFFKVWLFDNNIDKELYSNIKTSLIIIFSKYRMFRIILKRILKLPYFEKVNIYNRFAAFKNDKRF